MERAVNKSERDREGRKGVQQRHTFTEAVSGGEVAQDLQQFPFVEAGPLGDFADVKTLGTFKEYVGNLGIHRDAQACRVDRFHGALQRTGSRSPSRTLRNGQATDAKHDQVGGREGCAQLKTCALEDAESSFEGKVVLGQTSRDIERGELGGLVLVDCVVGGLIDEGQEGFKVLSGTGHGVWGRAGQRGKARGSEAGRHTDTDIKSKRRSRIAERRLIPAE